MNYSIIIPARFGSSRLLGKPLLDLAGKPLIQHVFEQAIKTKAKRVIIATDDLRIAKVVKKFGGEVCMTRPNHQSGTERIIEVINQLGFKNEDIVVNLQGDEPDIPPELIAQTANCLVESELANVSTLATPIKKIKDLFNPNVVKVVLNQKNYALYFSRAPIPWEQSHFTPPPQTLPDTYQWLRHIGLYGYRCGFLRKYKKLAVSKLEQIESLEQLRILAYGGKIKVDITQQEPAHGIDTIADLDAARLVFEQRKQ